MTAHSSTRLRFSLLDFKLGARMLIRYPGLTIVGALAMAFAIAIGAAAFEAVRQVVRPTLPFADGERLVGIRNWNVATNDAETRARDFVTWREQARTVRDLGAYRVVQRNMIVAGGDTGPLEVVQISPVAFRVTDTAPLMGRTLVAGDDQDNAPPVMVIGHDVWQTRFAGAADIVGRVVRLGAADVTIVGVMPPQYGFPLSHSAWTPLPARDLDHAYGEGPALQIFGMLAPGATLAQAQAELRALGQRATAETPRTHEHMRPQVQHYAEQSLPINCGESWTRCMSLLRTGAYTSNLLFVGFLLLVCANVALLMFARAAARESEMVVRNALGASRGRIVMQLVAEALVLGVIAAMLGLAAARLALMVALAILNELGPVPFWWQATLSWPSVLYIAGLTLLGALVAGALPALKVTRGTSVQLRQISAGAGGLRFGGIWTGVIVAQIALTVIVVFATFYTSRLTAGITSFDYGVATDEYLTARLAMDDAIPSRVYDEIERTLRAHPGVANVTFANLLPGMYHGREQIEVEGIAEPRGTQSAAVDPGFFDALRVPIVAGRAFTPADAASGAHVVIVNDQFVQRELGGMNALGRRVRFQVSEDPDEPWGPWHEIVGVTNNIRMGGDPELNPAGVYLPLQRGERASVRVAVHTRGAPDAFAPELRSAAIAIDPALRLHDVQSLKTLSRAEVAFYALWVRVLVGASLIVLALSLAGIYAIMAFTVSRRTREIGIRLALGANPRRLIASVFARPLRQVTLGVVIGVGLLVAAAGGIRSWQTALFVAAFTSCMLGVCMLACMVPMRRALRVEPTEALRAET